MTKKLNFEKAIARLTLDEILDTSLIPEGKLSKTAIKGISKTLTKRYGISKPEDFKPFESLLNASKFNHVNFACKIIEKHGLELSFKQKYQVLAASKSKGYKNRAILARKMIGQSQKQGLGRIIKSSALVVAGWSIASLLNPVLGTIIALGTTMVSSFTLFQTNKTSSSNAFLNLYQRNYRPDLVESDVQSTPILTDGYQPLRSNPYINYQSLGELKDGIKAGQSWMEYFKSYTNLSLYTPSRTMLFNAGKLAQMNDGETVAKIMNDLQSVQEARREKMNELEEQGFTLRVR